jgi:hypothetical protein
MDEYNNSAPNIVSDIRTYKGRHNAFSKVVHTYNAYDEDIATMEIFLDTPTILYYNSQHRLNWISFLSSIGGILGLCIGITIVTFVQILWMLFKLVFKILD